MSFLPVTPQECRARGWETPDFVYVTGDAFVVLYQPGALGPEAETAFPIPWSSLADITA